MALPPLRELQRPAHSDPNLPLGAPLKPGAAGTEGRTELTQPGPVPTVPTNRQCSRHHPPPQGPFSPRARPGSPAPVEETEPALHLPILPSLQGSMVPDLAMPSPAWQR